MRIRILRLIATIKNQRAEEKQKMHEHLFARAKSVFFGLATPPQVLIKPQKPRSQSGAFFIEYKLEHMLINKTNLALRALHNQIDNECLLYRLHCSLV